MVLCSIKSKAFAQNDYLMASLTFDEAYDHPGTSVSYVTDAFFRMTPDTPYEADIRLIHTDLVLEVVSARMSLVKTVSGPR